MLDSLPLNALRCFHQAARQLSFTRAAQTLNLTQSAVSQQMRLLESRLGFALFLRANRRLQLTEHGRVLFECVSNAFDDIESTLSRLMTQRRPLVVACCPSFALHWLVPRMAKFRQQEPLIETKIRAAFTLPGEDHSGAIDEAYADAVIGYWPAQRCDDETLPLMPEFLALAASPQYLRQHPGFARGETLQGVTILHDNAIWTGAPRHAEWQAWAGARKPDWLEVAANQYFNMSSMAMGAAVAHQGAAIVRSSLASEDLASGALSLLGPGWAPSPARYCLTVRRNAPEYVRTFARWLTRESEDFGRML